MQLSSCSLSFSKCPLPECPLTGILQQSSPLLASFSRRVPFQMFQKQSAPLQLYSSRISSLHVSINKLPLVRCSQADFTHSGVPQQSTPSRCPSHPSTKTKYLPLDVSQAGCLLLDTLSVECLLPGAPLGECLLSDVPFYLIVFLQLCQLQCQEDKKLHATVTVFSCD